MKFPAIKDVDTVDVIQIRIDDTINDAISKMYKYQHRSIIITNKNKHYILTASNIMKLKLSNYDLNKELSTIKLTELPTISKHDNILDAMEFLENDIEYFCAINDNGTLHGILTHTDIVTNIDPETLMENYRIGDLINMNKEIQKASLDTKASEVLDEIVQNGYDSIVIVSNNKPLGIVTTKDIMELLKNDSSLNCRIKEYMSSPVEVLQEDASIKDAIKFMKVKHFKRIIIVNKKGELSGLILQKELISLSYSKWSILIKQYSQELNEINTLLEQKNKKYEKMATTDSLTGLYNRYKFTELFVSEYSTMVKRDNDMSLIMMDIDYFKKVNDTYGHNIGDKVLQSVSNLLLKYLRNVDIVGRWGGEEFIAILPTATIENALILIDKIRIAISNYEMANSINITVSFGLTQIKLGDELIDAVSRADIALYEAKNSGRNCIKVNR